MCVGIERDEGSLICGGAVGVGRLAIGKAAMDGFVVLLAFLFFWGGEGRRVVWSEEFVWCVCFASWEGHRRKWEHRTPHF